MKKAEAAREAAEKGLYSPAYEHDSCGVGFVASIKGVATHRTIEQGLKILHNLDHRGAVGADPLCGDGAGIMIQIPDELFRAEFGQLGITLPPPGEYGVGMIFLPREPASRRACEEELERAVRAEGQVVIGWREVPVDHEMPTSPTVKASEPVIRQIFIGRGPDVMVQEALERRLYVIRKSASHKIQALKLTHGHEYFVPSMSTRTVVYKGLLLADQVGVYYRDLANPLCKSAIALVHQRFSTNTFPSWELAHPYRYIAHNGEINTVKGNFNWIRAREGMKSAVLSDEDLKKLSPLIYEGQSDTACLDNALELLVMCGYSLPHAVMMLIPEAWERAEKDMEPEKRALYEYNAAIMEPWDGPAVIAFTDGVRIGATLDRNGLRPARYVETDDDYVILASEAGVIPVPDSRIRSKQKLHPGKMLLIDTGLGRIISDEEVKKQLAGAHPYEEWTQKINIKLSAIEEPKKLPNLRKIPLVREQQAFGYTAEDLKVLMCPMAEERKEPLGSMGDDTSLPVLSSRSQSFYQYFKQLFAQVTNPPIDPIREEMVTSLISFIGPKPDLLDINNVNPPRRLVVNQPILNDGEMEKINQISRYTAGKFRSCRLSLCYPVEWGAAGVEAHLASLCAKAVDAVRSGFNILIVSDRGVDEKMVAVPALLATSALHQHLIKAGLRTQTGIVVETGSARETHHFALLAGFGAEAVHPYLAIETLCDYYGDGSAHGGLTGEKAVENYIYALDQGLTKIMAKMGISTYMSYRGAQIFEAIGLSQELMDRYFKGTRSSIGGLGLFDVMQEAVNMHHEAFHRAPSMSLQLDDGGEYAWRPRGEEHMWTPQAIGALQRAARFNDYGRYREYAQIINDQSKRHMTIRGLFDFKLNPEAAVPLSEVESADEIVKRFATGAMSLGSISAEAHAALAVAMNRIGGKSNTGEGGEDEKRYERELRTGSSGIEDGMTLADILGKDVVAGRLDLKKGDSLRSRIKQVASARFGVTETYLLSADQIQIKMAQGAKPGEGGHLPGKKVSPYIAKLRYSVPGVGLISPPPHHDIYSIEDLAQLIHDLKNANPKASISVKLVSESGVGTIAAGVAKAKADHIVISGHDGGTGASPLSSVKHAGTPWEIGLSETQQTLVVNRLRSRVRIQVDGQIKTGRDVVIGALLGADEFGFATAPLVVLGCMMMRKCHLNTCPAGIATQDPELRALFHGKPEHLVNYFHFVAEEVRELMASLGFRRFDDMIGRADCLVQRADAGGKASKIDCSRVLYEPEVSSPEERRNSTVQDHGLEKSLDWELIRLAKPALEKGDKVRMSLDVHNVNRTCGTLLSSQVALRYGKEGLPDDTIHVELHGSAGQSLGAFLVPGITLDLKGEANDYVGKGLCGGRIIVECTDEFHGRGAENVIAGNTTLYGATSGEAYFNGVVGERFAVRLSGASAVVEGCGDHGCEYMTGGTVVVLGETGRNFAAGMSGGIAYVYDDKGDFERRCNSASVMLERVPSSAEQERNESRALWHQGRTDEELLHELIASHYRYTGSARAKELLDNWQVSRARFVKIFPLEYRKVLQAGLIH